MGVVQVGWVAVCAWTSVAAAGTLIAPRLRASIASGETVRVTWTARSLTGKDGTTLELQRADADSTFAPVTSIAAPRRRGSFDDQPSQGGSYRYRGRVLTTDGTSAWSAEAAVDIEGATVIDPPGPAGDPPLPTGLTECPAGWIDDALRIGNSTRRSAGRGALVNHPKLAKAARIRTIDQANAQTLSHNGWVATIRAAGYSGGYLAENIAWGYSTPDAVMTGWIRSPGHLSNLLNNYRDSGVGCVVDRRGRLWWTQDFGF